MKEELLHFIWQGRHFNSNQLTTIDGKSVELIHPGTYNPDSGPDFFNAKLLIDKTLWAGNVEMHLESSNWMQHGHQFDQAYNNVILHVVYEHNENIVNANGEVIPTVELRSLIPSNLLNKYGSLGVNNKWIACEHLLPEATLVDHEGFVNELLIERLEDRMRYIQKDVKLNRGNWEQTFFEYLARNFGFKVNALPFHLLAKSIPIDLISRHTANYLQIQALIFGQAGLLNCHFHDSFPKQLKVEYEFLRMKHQLDNISDHLWKYATLRPANFPTIRLAEFSALLFGQTNLFSTLLESNDRADIVKLFDFEINPYWNDHYQFDQKSPEIKKSLGKSSIDNIIINTVVPFLYTYGHFREKSVYIDKAMFFLKSIKGETNGIVRNWKKLGFQINNAFESQAYIQLKNMYCTPKKCLSCGIGKRILNP